MRARDPRDLPRSPVQVCLEWKIKDHAARQQWRAALERLYYTDKLSAERKVALDLGDLLSDLALELTGIRPEVSYEVEDD